MGLAARRGRLARKFETPAARRIVLRSLSVSASQLGAGGGSRLTGGALAWANWLLDVGATL
jgi:hypothetical protein